MSLKSPKVNGQARTGAGDAGLDAFALEAMAETAAALGHIGKQLEDALEDIRRHDANPGSNRDRQELVQNAADRAWAMFIQRDYFGMKCDHHLFAAYDIPKEVLNRVGVKQRPH
jgi:hypothetical protein